jgi:uncharacterized membrane protein
MSEQFTAADLAPSPDERNAHRRALLERAAAATAVIAAGVWMGGMIALGACAAPFVFRLTPAPFSGDAMGAAFARFDQIAIGASAVILGSEVVRTVVARRRGRALTARIRRFIAIGLACAATYLGLVVTPRIQELHRAGAVRNQGAGGQELNRIHRQAELLGRLEVALGCVLIVLHIFTLPAHRPEESEDDEEDAPAPLPPGPA